MKAKIKKYSADTGDMKNKERKRSVIVSFFNLKPKDNLFLLSVGDATIDFFYFTSVGSGPETVEENLRKKF